MSEPNPPKRKREAAARRSHEPTSAPGDSALFLELMDCMEDAVLILGADLSILRANRGATFLTGYSEAELGEMSLLKIFLPKDRRWVKAAIKDM